MIGFDAIGQVAIGEIGGSDDVLIFAPSIDVTVTTSVPVIIGTQIFAPSTAVVVSGAVPLVAGGKSVKPPSAAVTVTIFPPRISISATISPPSIPVVVSSSPGQPQAGNVILATNTVTMNTLYGEIGSSSIGEFATGEGDPSARIAFLPPFVVVAATLPLVAAGKSIFAPAINVTVTAVRPEVDSRRRKLRVFAIAS